MEKDSIVAIAFSDLHIHNFKAFNHNGRRLSNCISVLEDIGKTAEEHNVPVLFPGDLIHNPKVIENNTLFQLISGYKNFLYKVPFFAINGNHDMSQKNTINHKSRSYLDTMDVIFPNFQNISMDYVKYDDMVVFGIPYLNGNIGFKRKIKEFVKIAKEYPNEKKILLFHGDWPGAVNSHEYEIKDTEGLPKNLDNYLKAFDLVLCGHIHLPQKLGKNVWMLGSPQHQNWGDRNAEMGYWLIYRYRDPEFVYLDKYPKFREYQKGELIDDHDFWVETISEGVNKLDEANSRGFDIRLNKVKIAKNYLKANKITDKDKKEVLIDLLRNL